MSFFGWLIGWFPWHDQYHYHEPEYKPIGPARGKFI